MIEKVNHSQLIKNALDKKKQILVVDKLSGNHMIAESYAMNYGVLIDYKRPDKAYCTWEDNSGKRGQDFFIDSLKVVDAL